jgi:hypothetical protein
MLDARRVEDVVRCDCLLATYFIDDCWHSASSPPVALRGKGHPLEITKERERAYTILCRAEAKRERVPCRHRPHHCIPEHSLSLAQ